MSASRQESELPGVPGYFPFAVPASSGLPRLLRLARLPRQGDGVRFDGDVLDVRFGPWHLTTPAANIRSASIGGPYTAWRVLGPRLSLADRGITFGTTTTAGVCVLFHNPVRGIEPTGLLRHPNMTVTVAQPERLVSALRAVTGSQ
jgi:hypothetical protein